MRADANISSMVAGWSAVVDGSLRTLAPPGRCHGRAFSESQYSASGRRLSLSTVNDFGGARVVLRVGPRAAEGLRRTKTGESIHQEEVELRCRCYWDTAGIKAFPWSAQRGPAGARDVCRVWRYKRVGNCRP